MSPRVADEALGPLRVWEARKMYTRVLTTHGSSTRLQRSVGLGKEPLLQGAWMWVEREAEAPI